MSHKTINVPNISCGHCVMTIERELGELDGVTAVKADAATKQVSVEWSEDDTNFSAVLDLLDEIGFPAAS